MLIKVLRSKIHRATVTDINNAARHETYVQLGERGAGQIVLNGAVALVSERNEFVKYI